MATPAVKAAIDCTQVNKDDQKATSSDTIALSFTFIEAVDTFLIINF